MTKSDLINALANELNISLREASSQITTILDTMTESLCRGEAIQIRGFGSFVVKQYEGYTGRQPKTGKTINVKSKKLPLFRAGKELRKKMNEAHQGQ